MRYAYEFVLGGVELSSVYYKRLNIPAVYVSLYNNRLYIICSFKFNYYSVALVKNWYIVVSRSFSWDWATPAGHFFST